MVSDNSDIEHVSVSADPRLCTEQDRERQRIATLVQFLRERPLLPPDPNDATRSWEGPMDGLKFPTAHCAFSGCAWTGTCEEELWQHLHDEHAQCIAETCNVKFPGKRSRCTKEERDEFQMEILAYYNGAIALIEQEGIPAAGCQSVGARINMLRRSMAARQCEV